MKIGKSLVNTFQIKGITAASITAVGIIGLGTSVLLFLIPEKQEESMASIDIQPRIQGVSMSIHLRH
ncbi:MAG: hypothetical protein JEY99_17810 [Spirochaetales bacterium]|nr:hypothetical protein [Spirochaetales bacterium]